MVGVAEVVRRVSTRATHRIHTLPVLALNVHTGCNCRCVMCDIWMANADNREISVEELDAHLNAIRRLRVQRVMLTGGEPLLHRNLWRLCGRLRDQRIRVTLVTTGLLVGAHAQDIAAYVDDLVVSIDGAPDVHDAIRRVRGGFRRVERGLQLLTNYAARPRTTARCVVQRMNCARLVEAVDAVRSLPLDHLSFLAADVSSPAFNRPQPWSQTRRGEVALSEEQLPLFAAAIREVEHRCSAALESGFIVNGLKSLWRIHDYYCALAGIRPFSPTRCNAPWISAVLEPGGQIRPCFFHKPYRADAGKDLADSLNSSSAVAFRRSLNVTDDETCKRCVCTLSVPPWADV
jgi:MoaA/NifB/PqqE/SkfB family radical SAM enzyme